MHATWRSEGRTLALAASLLLLVVMPLRARETATADLTPTEVARLNAGKVVVKSEAYTSAGGGCAATITAYCVINTPLDAVWAVMLDYQKFDEFMPRLAKVEILERTQDTMKVTETVSVMLGMINYTLDLRFDRAQREVRWTLDKSRKHDIAETSGTWEFFSYGRGKTLVRYAMAVDSGRFVPKFLEAFLLKNSVPEVLSSLRRRTESDGTWQKERGEARKNTHGFDEGVVGGAP